MNFNNVENYKELYDFNYVTFLNKDSIKIKLNTFFKKRRHRKIQKFIDSYIHEDTNISVILINKKERQKIKNDKSYFFDGNQDPQTNVLYYKFNTGNDLHEYFTYEKYLLKKDEYNIGLMKRLTSRLGLKKIEIDQKTRNSMVNKYGKDSSIMLNIKNLNPLALELKNIKENESENIRHLETKDILEDHGCELFFKSFRQRDVWCEKFYTENKIPQIDLIKQILSEQKYYTYESYESNHELVSKIDQRLNGMESVSYKLTENEFESSINKKFIKLDFKIRKYFGIGVSQEYSAFHLNNNYINKNLEIIFHEIRSLELNTVVREIKRLKTKIDTEVINENDNFSIVKDKIKDICIQLETLKSGLTRCKELDQKYKEERKYSYDNSFKDIEKLLKKMNEAKANKDLIMSSRMDEVIEEIGKVQHNGYWNNGKSTNNMPHWSCCNHKYYNSSCTNTHKKTFRNLPRKDYLTYSINKPTINNEFPIKKEKKYTLSEIAELAIDEFGNSIKYPGMVFDCEYVSGYNANNDSINNGYYMVKRIK